MDTMNHSDRTKSQQTSSLLRESAQILAATEQERMALEIKLKKTAKELYTIHDELYAVNAQREKESTIANFEIQRLHQINKAQEQKEAALLRDLAANEENVRELTALLDQKDALLQQLENELIQANQTISEQKTALEQVKDTKSTMLRARGRSPSPSPMRRKPSSAQTRVDADSSETLRSEITAKDAIIANLQADLAPIQERVIALEEALTQTKQGQDAAEERLWQLNNELQDTLLKLEESRQFCAALETNANLKDSLAERDLLDMELLIGSNKGNLKIIEQLKAECKALHSQNAELRHSSQQQGQENTVHELEIAELKRTVDSWQKQFAAAEAKSKDLQEQLEKIHLVVQGELDTMQTEHDAALKAMEEALTLKSTQDQQTLTQQLETVHAENQELTETVSTLEGHLNVANQSIAELDAVIEGLHAEIGKLEAEVASRDAEIVNYQKEYFELKTELQSSLEEVQTELDEQRKVSAIATEAMHQTSNNMLELVAEKDALSQQLEVSNAELDQHRGDLNRLQRELFTMEAEMLQARQSANDLISTQKQELSIAAERIAQLDEDMQHVADSYEKLSAEKRHSEHELHATIAAQQTQLETLLSVNLELQKQVEEALEKSELLQSDVVRLQVEQTQCNVRALATEDSLKLQLKDAQTDLNAKIESIDSLSKQISSFTDEIALKTDLLSDAKATIDSLTSQVDVLQGERTHLESGLLNRDDIITDLKAESDKVSLLLTEVEAAIQSKDQQIAYLESQHQSLCDKHSELSAAYESSTAQLQAAQAELQSIQDKSEQERQEKLLESSRRKEKRTYQDRSIVSAEKKELASSFDNQMVIPSYAMVNFEPVDFSAAETLSASSAAAGGSAQLQSPKLSTPSRKKTIKVTSCGTALGYVARNEAAISSLSNPLSTENIVKSLKEECADLKKQVTSSTEKLLAMEEQLAETLALYLSTSSEKDALSVSQTELIDSNAKMSAQITELEVQLKALTANEVTHKTLISSLQETLQQKSADLEVQESRIDELTSEATRLIEDVTNLSNDYDVACDEIQQREDELSEARKRIAVMERVKEALEATMTDLTQKLTDLSQYNEQLSDELSRKTQELNVAVQEDVVRLQQQLEKCKSELKEMNQRHDDLTVELQSVRSETQLEVDQLVETRDALEESLKKSELCMEELTSRHRMEVQVLEEQLKKALEDIDKLQSDLSDCYDECKTCQQKESSAVEDSVKQQTEVERLTQALRDAQQRLSGYQEDNETLRNAANKMQGQYVNETKSFSAEILDYMSKITQLSKELAESKAQNASFQETIVVLDATIDEQNVAISHSEQTINELEKQVGENEAQLVSAQSELSELRSDLTRLKHELQISMTCLQTMTTESSEKDEVIARDRELINSLQSELAEVKSRHEEDGAKHSEHHEITSNVISSLKEQNSDLQSEIDAMTKAVNDKNSWLENMHQEQIETTKTIALLESKLSELRGEVATKSQRVNELTKELQTEQSDCETWKREWASVDAQLKAKTEALQQSDACVRNCQVESVALKQRHEETRIALESANQQLTEQKHSIETLQDRIVDLESHLKNHQSSAEKWESDADSAQGVIDSLRSEVARKSESILQLSQKVNAGEIDLYAKQRQLDEVSGALQDKEQALRDAEKSLSAAQEALAAEKLTATQQKEVFSGIIASFKDKNKALDQEKISLSESLIDAEMATTAAQAEIDMYKTQFLDWNQQTKEFESEIVKLNGQLDEAKSVHATLTSDKVSLSEKLIDTQMAANASKVEAESLSVKVIQLEVRLTTLTQELAEARANKEEEAVHLSEDLLDAEMQVSATKAELDLYRAQSFAWNNGTKEYEARISALNAELSDAQKSVLELTKLTTDFSNDRAAWEVEQGQLKAQLSAVQVLESILIVITQERDEALKEVETLESQLAEMQTEIDSLKVSAENTFDLVMSTDELSQSNAELSAEVSQLRQDISERDNDLQSMTDLYSSVSSVNSDLKKQLETLVEQRTADAETMQQLRTKNSEDAQKLFQFKKDEQKWKQQHELSNTILKSIQDENAKFKLECAQLKKDNSRLQKEVNELTDDMDDMVLAKNEVEADLNKTSDKLTKVEGSLKEALKKISALESMLPTKEPQRTQELSDNSSEPSSSVEADLRKEIDVLKQQVQAEVDKLSKQKEVSSSLISSMKDKHAEDLSDKNASLAAKDNQLAQMKLELNTALLNSENLRMEVAAHKAVCAEAVDNHEKSQECIGLLNTTLKELQEKHSRTSEQLREAFESLTALRKERDDLISEKEKLLKGKEVSAKLIATLKADAEKLKQEKEVQSVGTVNQANVEEANLALYSIQKEYDELLTNYQSCKAALNAEISDLRTKLERSEEENESLRERVPLIPKSKQAASDGPDVAALQASLESMKVDQRNALAMIRKMEIQVSEYAAELEAKIGEAQQSKSSCHLLQIDVGLLKQAKADLEARVAHLEELLKFERDASEGLQAHELKDAEKSLEKLQKQKEISDRLIQSLREELADLQDKVTEQEEIIADMTNDINRATESLVLKSLAEKRLDLLKGSLQALETQLADKEAALVVSEEKLAQALSNKEESSQGSSKQNKRRNSKDVAELAALNQQVSLLKAEKQQTQEVWTKLLNEKDATISSLQAESALLLGNLNNQRAAHDALKQTNHDLHSQITALLLVQESVESLQQQLQKETDKNVKQKEVTQQLVSNLKDKNSGLEGEKSKLESELRSVKQRVSDLDCENGALKAVCENLQKMLESADASAKSAAAALEAANRKAAESDKDSQELTDLRDRVEQLNTQVESLEKLKREFTMREFDALNKFEAAQGTRKQLEDQLAVQHKDIQFLNVMYERTKTEVGKLNGALQTSSDQIKNLERQLIESSDAIAQKEALMLSLNQSLAEKTQECSATQCLANERQLQVDDLKAQMTAMQLQLAESWNTDMGSKESMEAMKQAQADLEQRLSKETEKAAKQKEVMSGVIKTLKEDNTALKLKLDEVQSAFDEKAIAVMQLEAQLQYQDSQMTALKNNAQASNSEYKDVVDARDRLVAEKQSLEASVGDLQNKLSTLKTANSALERSVKDLKASLTSQKTQSEERLADLRSQLATAQSSISDLNKTLIASQSEFESLLRENEVVKSEKDVLNASVAAVKKQMAALQVTNTTLTDEIAALTKSLDAKTQDIKKLMTEKEKLSAKSAEKVDEMESELVMLRSQLTNFETANKALDQKYEKLTCENADLHAQITALMLVQDAHSQEVSGVNAQKQAEIDKLLKHKEITGNLVNTLKEKNSSLEQQMSDLLVEYDAKNKEHLVLNEAVKLLQHELLSFRMERDHLENSLELTASLLEEKNAYNSLLLAESVALNALVEPSGQAGQLRQDLDDERDKLLKYKESTNALIDTLKDRIAKQDVLFGALNEESEKATAKLLETEDALSALRMTHDAEVSRLRDELFQTQKSNEVLTGNNQEVHDLQMEIEHLHHTLSLSNSNKILLDDLVVRLRGEKDHIQSELSDWKKKHAEVEEELHHLNVKYTDLLAERDFIQQSLNNSKPQNDSGLDYSNIYTVNDADQHVVQTSNAQFGEMIRHPSFKKAESCYIDMSEIYGDNVDVESESEMDDTLRLSATIDENDLPLNEGFEMTENEMRSGSSKKSKGTKKSLERKDSCFVDISAVYDEDEEVIVAEAVEDSDDFIYYAKDDVKRSNGTVPMTENKLRTKKPSPKSSVDAVIRPYSMTENELRVPKKDRQQNLERKESCFVDMSTVYDDADGDLDEQYYGDMGEEQDTFSTSMGGADAIPMMENEMRRPKNQTLLKRESELIDMSGIYSVGEDEMMQVQGAAEELLSMRKATNDLTPVKSVSKTKKQVTVSEPEAKQSAAVVKEEKKPRKVMHHLSAAKQEAVSSSTVSSLSEYQEESHDSDANEDQHIHHFSVELVVDSQALEEKRKRSPRPPLKRSFDMRPEEIARTTALGRLLMNDLVRIDYSREISDLTMFSCVSVGGAVSCLSSMDANDAAEMEMARLDHSRGSPSFMMLHSSSSTAADEVGRCGSPSGGSVVSLASAGSSSSGPASGRPVRRHSRTQSIDSVSSSGSISTKSHSRRRKRESSANLTGALLPNALRNLQKLTMDAVIDHHFHRDASGRLVSDMNVHDYESESEAEAEKEVRVEKEATVPLTLNISTQDPVPHVPPSPLKLQHSGGTSAGIAFAEKGLSFATLNVDTTADGETVNPELHLLRSPTCDGVEDLKNESTDSGDFTIWEAPVDEFGLGSGDVLLPTQLLKPNNTQRRPSTVASVPRDIYSISEEQEEVFSD